MNNSITLKDIAKALHLSTSTISKALNDSYEIGEETKKRVMAYAKEHHYVPNRMAKGLKQGKSRSIGVVVCCGRVGVVRGRGSCRSGGGA